jgi:hypothetical protein
VLSASVQRAFDRLATDVQRVFGARFVALVAYGHNASVAFASSLDADDLHALGPLVGSWHHEGLATPLLITPDEFRRSLDTFPLEFQVILDRHIVIAGTPPFDHAMVRMEDLRRACEAQARGHIIHLRQGWIQAGGHDSHLVDLLVRSADPFRALLSNVALLHAAPHETDDQLVAFAQDTIGMSGDVVRLVLGLTTRREQGHQLLARVNDYLAAAERLWDFVDRWRAS